MCLHIVVAIVSPTPGNLVVAGSNVSFLFAIQRLVNNNIVASRYAHKGDLAYVGSDKAVMQLPTFGLIQGSGAYYLWRGYETYRQISFRNRCLVAFDTLRSKVFGRDIEFGETDMPGDS